MIVIWFGIGDPPTIARVGLGILYLLALPGYVLTIVVFPHSDDGGSSSQPIDSIDRYALSIGLSIAILPILGVALAASPFGITAQSAIAGLAGITAGGALSAILRRRKVAPNERFYPTLPNILTGNRASVAVNLTLVIAVTIALGMFGFAIAFPQPGETTTEFYLTTEDGTGESTASGYPDEISLGESVELDVTIENHEGKSTEYTLVAIAEELDDAGNVTDRETLIEEEIHLADGSQWTGSPELTPSISGENIRISYLLYRGDAHFYLDQRTAYRHTHIYLDVNE